MSIRPHTNPNTSQTGHRVDVSRRIDGKLVRLTKVVYDWPMRDVRRLEEKLKAELRAMELGTVPLPGKDRKGPLQITLQDLIDRYLDFSKKAHRGARAHIDQSRALLRYFDHSLLAAKISHDDVVRYMKWRREQRTNRGTSISPTTVDKEVALMGRLYKHAFMNDLLDPSSVRNPAEYVKLARVPTRRERILSHDELRRLLAALSPFHRAIVLVARFTGLRQHHVLSLNWEQVSEETIHPQDFQPDRSLYLSTKRFGLPPIPAGLFSIVPGGPQQQGRMWIWRGHPIHTVRTAFLAGCEVARIEGLVFHDLRRTYLTHLRRIGVDPFVTQVIAGHAVPRELQIHARYQVVSREEIAAVGRLISNSEEYQDALNLCTYNAHTRWDKRKSLRTNRIFNSSTA